MGQQIDSNPTAIVGVQSIIGPFTKREGAGPERRLTIRITAWRGPDGRLRQDFAEQLTAFWIGSESEVRAMALAAAGQKLLALEVSELASNKRDRGMVGRIVRLARSEQSDPELESLYREPPIPHAFVDADFGDFLLNLDLYEGQVRWAGQTVDVSIGKQTPEDVDVLRALKAEERSWSERHRAWLEGDVFETWSRQSGGARGVTAAEFADRLEVVCIMPQDPKGFVFLLRGEGVFEGFAKVEGELDRGFFETRF